MLFIIYIDIRTNILYTKNVISSKRGKVMYEKIKPMLSANEQINHLKNKGITFNLPTESEAKEYLTKNNNFFKLVSYRKNYQKYDFGLNVGKYINLDFKMLSELAILDMRLRKMLLSIVLDLEHYLKIKILNVIENNSNDGYKDVKEYIDSLNEDEYKKFDSEISRNSNSPYCKEIYEKYKDDYPVWAFLEIIPFGRLINFYSFLAKSIGDKEMIDESFMLKNVRDLRNACAHNNCILNDLRSRYYYLCN